MLNAFLFDGLRTAFGRHAGGLSSVRPDELLAASFKALIDKHGIDPLAFDDVVVGCANQAGEDSRCVARHASLLAGFPVELGGTVLQRNCGSGLGAAVAASHAITAGEAEAILSGGVESMSRAPFVMGKAESAYSRDLRIFDSAVGSRFPNPKIEAEHGEDSMPQTADNLALEHNISRNDADEFALQSQQRYAAALARGFFNDEITGFDVRVSKTEVKVIDKDEQPRAATNLESLAKLRALNEGGVTTAGNASSINDGAVALILGTQAFGQAKGLAPMARILASATAGVAPRIMGYGPVPAAEKALARAGLTIADMDVIEINEAFAAQVLACAKGMKLGFNDERLNPNGGAIALGHPLGASGPRLLLTAARALKERSGRYALVSMCIGVGQGIAMIIERTGD
jgi:acetyl-CoA C-acetyltransferase